MKASLSHVVVLVFGVALGWLLSSYTNPAPSTFNVEMHAKTAAAACPISAPPAPLASPRKNVSEPASSSKSLGGRTEASPTK